MTEDRAQKRAGGLPPSALRPPPSALRPPPQMPGITGIISRQPAAECERMVQSMTGAMRHESFYSAGQFGVPDLGVYGGWVALEQSPAASQPFFNEKRDVVLLLSGECFPEAQTLEQLRSKGHEFDRNGAEWLVHLYEEEGDGFFEKLNGLFSGLLIDRRQKRVILFNDRYGFDRIYFHETPDAFYFASDAAALLRILPHLREFDPEGVKQFLAVGCTLEGQTLFRGLRLLPGGSAWSVGPGRCTKTSYFLPATWEEQEVLSAHDFQSRFQETLRRIVPRYFESDLKVGVALTAGLDSRMVLACRPALTRQPVCYTYGGRTGEMRDTRLAARVAGACGMEHHVLRIGADFFSDFSSHVDQTIRATSGCFGLLGAHEIYLNRRARELALVRVTGVCGGEILREVCTFKPLGLAPDLLAPELRASVIDWLSMLRISGP